MKINFLLLLFFSFCFSFCSCTTNETEIKDSFNNEKSATSELPSGWGNFKVRIIYNSNLSKKKINHIRNYYFKKYNENHSTNRLLGITNTTITYEETWLGIRFTQGMPGLDDEINTEIGDDPNITIP